MLFFSKFLLKSRRLPGWPAACALTGLLAALLAGPAARAQLRQPQPAAADTLTGRLHRLPEARVRGPRLARFAVGSSRLEVDSAGLAQYRGATAADVLGFREGLYVKNYGPGQLATISLRGTAAQHTAVLWQGLNIALPTLGQNDLALLPLSGTTSLTVQPGPAAALYGSGAIGGAIVLGTEPDWQPGLRGSVQADAGSYGLRGTTLEGRAATRALAVRLAASYRQATNNYPYTVQEPGGPVRYTLRNAALRHQYSFSPDLTWRVGAAGELTAAAWLTEADREIQSGTGLSGLDARELDQSRRLVLGYRRALNGGGQWQVRGAWFEDVLDYTPAPGSPASRSRVRTTQAQAEYNAALGTRATLRLGLEAQHFAALVDGYGGDPLAENRAAAFALLRYDPLPRLRLTANLRQAALPAGLAPFTPTIGAEYDLLAHPADSLLTTSPPHHLTLKASAARSYRAPTLNERYWLPGGNPDLRPESGGGGEVGLRYQQGRSRQLLWSSELTAYSQLVSDWVQWLPLGPGGSYSPRNLRQVRSRGLEASAELRRRRGRYQGSVRATYALTETQKTQGTAADADPVGVQLYYVPLHRGSVTLDQQYRGWLASAAYAYASYVYTTTSADAFLPGGGLLSGTLGRTQRWGGSRASTTLLVQGFNLLGRDYQSYPGRPGPPRSLVVSLRLTYD